MCGYTLSGLTHGRMGISRRRCVFMCSQQPPWAANQSFKSPQNSVINRLLLIFFFKLQAETHEWLVKPIWCTATVFFLFSPFNWIYQSTLHEGRGRTVSWNFCFWNICGCVSTYIRIPGHKVKCISSCGSQSQEFESYSFRLQVSLGKRASVLNSLITVYPATKHSACYL